MQSDTGARQIQLPIPDAGPKGRRFGGKVERACIFFSRTGNARRAKIRGKESERQNDG